MSDDGIWDEERYANEMFENDSDAEIQSVSDSDCDNTNVTQIQSKPKGPMQVPSNNFNHYYAKRNTQNATPYNSSSDDDDDVVFSKSIAEINPEPMHLEEAMSPHIKELKRLKESPYIPFEALIKKLRESEEVYYSKDSDDCSQVEEDLNGDTNESDLDDEDDLQPTGETEEQDEYELLDAPDTYNKNKEKLSEIKESFKLNNDRDNSETVTQQSEDDLQLTDDNETIEKNSEYKKWNLPTYESDIIETNFMLQSGMEGDFITSQSTLHESVVETIQNTLYKQESKHLLTTVTETDNEVEVESDLQEYAETDTVTMKNGATDDDEEEHSEDENEDENDDESEDSDSQLHLRICSRRPSSYNSEFAFHLDLMKDSNEKLKRPIRKSWSFTNARLREIERQNHILLRKILSLKPTYTLNPEKKKTPNKFASLPSTTRVASAAVNRKKQQRQIDLDNQLLKRRIEAISLRRPQLK